MYSEYSLLALSAVLVLIALIRYAPLDLDWSVMDDEDFQEIDLDENAEIRTAAQANKGAAATSAM